MAEQLAGTRYKDMTDEYKASVSQDEYKARRRAQNQAMERVKKYQSGQAAVDSGDIYNVTDLKDFDLRAGGSGGALARPGQGDGGYEKGDDQTISDAQYGAGKAKLSGNDVRRLWKSKKFTLNDLKKYADGLGDSAKVGGKADRFLEKKIAKLGGDAIYGGGGGGDTGGGDTGGGDTGGGTTGETTHDEEETTIPADGAGDQNRQLTNNAVTTIGGDNNGYINNSVNDYSINNQFNGSGGSGGDYSFEDLYADGWRSTANAIGLIRQQGALSENKARDHYHEMMSYQNQYGGGAKAGAYGERSDAITSHFGHGMNLAGSGLLSSLNEISQFVPKPAEKIEPNYDDDDD